ncbi:Ig-like domain-containing protein [Lujinxingia vulgaris]|nr:Ig-like domain-containing protein [Lujinxingia vulgaris]
MMGSYTTKLLALLAAGGLSLTMACGESTVNVPTDEDPRDHEQPDIPGTSRLEHVEPCDAAQLACTRTLAVEDSATISVRLVDADGNPIRNAMVGFALETVVGAQGATLSAANDITDDNGIASTTVRTGGDPNTATGTIRVEATVDQEGVNALEFNMGINAKDSASYIVEYEHAGSAVLDSVETLFLPPTVTCDAAEEAFNRDGLWPSADFVRNATVNADGSINDVILPSVANNTAYTIIGSAIQNVGTREVSVAVGCSENNPPVQNGVSTVVEIELFDYFPTIAGTYQVTHAFDLRSGLPPSVREVIDLIGTLAESPARFVLGCPATIDYCDGGTRGLLDFLLDFAGDSLGSFADTLRDFQSNGTLMALALDFLDDAIEGFLPPWAVDGQQIIGDVVSMLEAFVVEGSIIIDEQPVIDLASGQATAVLLPENNRQLWNDIVLTWSRGCENQSASCSEVRIRSFDVGENGSAVFGNFGATMIGATALEIDKHPLTLQYGNLILAVIERVLLPRLFADAPTPIDSLEAMLGELIDCEGLADEVSNPGQTLYNAVVQACEVLQDEAADTVRDYVNDSLVADSSDNFRIGTPTGEPCEIYQPAVYPPGASANSGWPGYPLPFIQTLGTPELRCKWEAEFRFSTESQPSILDGTFYGNRSDSGN